MAKTKNLTENDKTFLLKAWEFQIAGKSIKDLATSLDIKVTSTNSKLSALRSIENLQVPTFERATRSNVSIDDINNAVKTLKEGKNEDKS